MGDSQATFSRSAIRKIRETYDYRCVICLTNIPTSECAHIIDAAAAGQQQLRNAVKLGILPQDYKRSDATNGTVQCPNCHSLFTQNLIVLSLPIPLLKYLETYVRETPKARQKPLHKVFDLLLDALSGQSVALPNPKPILPYLGLYTIVTLKPAQVVGIEVGTQYLPHLSIPRAGKFVTAPANTSATARNVARIFDPFLIDADTPRELGTIPLSPQHPRFKERRFWRVTAPAAAIFAALISRLDHDSSDCEDIALACNIRDILGLQKRGYGKTLFGGADPTGGSGPSRNKRRDGGGDGNGSPGSRKSKRKAPDSKQDATSGSGQKKPRKAAGYLHAAFDWPSQERLDRKQNDCRTTSSPVDDAAEQSMLAHCRGSSSETGLSISAIHPHDKDNPDRWRFDPSFSTHKIVFMARGVSLT